MNILSRAKIEATLSKSKQHLFWSESKSIVNKRSWFQHAVFIYMGIELMNLETISAKPRWRLLDSFDSSFVIYEAT